MKTEKTITMIKQLTVKIPGSTANLGPGFDTLALALSIYNKLSFSLATGNKEQQPKIILKGAIAEKLPSDETNLVYNVIQNKWRNCPELLKGLEITIESQIPLAAGLGSSASAILGTLWAAERLEGVVPDSNQLLAEATKLEGHADNLSASLLGGLVVCSQAPNSNGVVTQRLTWPDKWHTLVVVPQYGLKTHEARAVLPDKVSYGDAVLNIQRTALLISAVVNHDEMALHKALHDRLHEPYRAALMPELAAIRKHLGDLPFLGCVLSGAGPSVLVIVNERHKKQVLNALGEWAARVSNSPQILDLHVDQHGIQELVSEK